METGEGFTRGKYSLKDLEQGLGRDILLSPEHIPVEISMVRKACESIVAITIAGANGSGFILEGGLLVTAGHAVAANRKNITRLHFPDRSLRLPDIEAKVVRHDGLNPYEDYAVFYSRQLESQPAISINKSRRQPGGRFSEGDSGWLDSDGLYFTIGYPMERVRRKILSGFVTNSPFSRLEQAIGTGRVLNYRPADHIHEFDGLINPGMSGGVIVDRNGTAVGINLGVEGAGREKRSVAIDLNYVIGQIK